MSSGLFPLKLALPHGFWQGKLEPERLVRELHSSVSLSQLYMAFSLFLTLLLVAGILAAVAGTFMGTAQKRWSESVKHRVNDTTTVLRSMKETKLLGLVDSWRSRITVLMENQIQESRLFRKLIILINVAGKSYQVSGSRKRDDLTCNGRKLTQIFLLHTLWCCLSEQFL